MEHPLKEQKTNSNPLRLRWYEFTTGEFFKAGVAFYNERFGDYTLKLNMNRGKIYVRPFLFEDENTCYRVEEVKIENGRLIKEEVGYGVMNKSTEEKIHIKLGGYSEILILG